MRNKLTKTVISSVYKSATRPFCSQSSKSEEVKPWKDIPTLPSLPIIGQLYHYLPGGMMQDLPTLQKTLYPKYGPIVRIESNFGMPEQLYLFDPEATAEVLRGENWAPVRPGFFSLRYYRKMRGESNIPQGLITEDGERWKKFRNAVTPALMHTKTINLYSDAIAEVADDLIQRLKFNRDSKNMLTKNLSHELSLWSLESIGVVALGRRLKCLDPNLSPDSPEMRLVKLVHEVFEMITKLDFRPNLSFFIKTPAFNRAMKNYEEQENLIHYFLEKTQEELKASNEPRTEENKSILEKLLEIDERYAIGMANDMIFAGVDTTSNSVIYILFLLAKNPEKQKKLREEVMNVKDPNNRKYLKACIKETFRVLPLVPGNLRMTTKEYNLLGYRVPKNVSKRVPIIKRKVEMEVERFKMMVIMYHQLMCSLESQYPLPEEFIPERWLEKEGPLSYSNAHPFAYSPFGFGVRSCIGRRIAQLEMETLVSKVVESFQLEWFGSDTLNIVQKTVNAVEPPYNFIFKDNK